MMSLMTCILMIDGKSILAVIPARGGSKGVKRKNLRNIGGKPLIEWTIDAAKNAQYVDRVIFSSEDQELMDVAAEIGCEVPFVRPDDLATDTASMIDVVCHAIRECGETHDYVVLLQPTSPLRNSEDIDQVVSMCVKNNAPACISVSKVSKSPYWMYERKEKGLISPLKISPEIKAYRRQDLPSIYQLNGAIYFADSRWLLERNSFVCEETISYVMPSERSVDVDEELDLIMINTILSMRNDESEKH
jgi:CMP-N,N'-diacetyllegionaminic acid synthase